MFITYQPLKYIFLLLTFRVVLLPVSPLLLLQRLSYAYGFLTSGHWYCPMYLRISS